MGLFSFLFGDDTPRSMTGNEVDPAKASWWSDPPSSQDGPAPSRDNPSDNNFFDGFGW